MKKFKNYRNFSREANSKLDQIREKDYEILDDNSRSEYDGLKKMFNMLLEIDLKELKNKNQL